MTNVHQTQVEPMKKEISCKNWVQLLDYIENRPDLQGGLSGRDAVEKVLEGLVGNPEFLIQDPDNPDLAYPVKEDHLRNPRYWHSHKFFSHGHTQTLSQLLWFQTCLQVPQLSGYHEKSLLLGALPWRPDKPIKRRNLSFTRVQEDILPLT